VPRYGRDETDREIDRYNRTRSRSEQQTLSRRIELGAETKEHKPVAGMQCAERRTRPIPCRMISRNPAFTRQPPRHIGIGCPTVDGGTVTANS